MPTMPMGVLPDADPSGDTFVSSGERRRASLDAPLPVPYGGKKTYPNLIDLEGLSDFIKKRTTIKAMRECSVLWHVPCRRPLCPWCAEERKKERRSDWLDRIDPNARSLYCRLSVASSHDLGAAWDALAATRRVFGRRSWLSSTSSAWLRTTEETTYRGMHHWHDNVLVLGSSKQLQHVRNTIAARWCAAASTAGVEASVAAQYVMPSRSTEAVKVYMLKGLMDYAAEPDRGETPGDVLRNYFYGDPAAAERWAELEAFILEHPHLQLSNKGADFRGG